MLGESIQIYYIHKTGIVNVKVLSKIVTTNVREKVKIEKEIFLEVIYKRFLSNSLSLKLLFYLFL